MNGISGIVSLVGILGSLVGMGSSTVSQVAMARQQLQPTQIQQQCPPNTTPTPIILADGSKATLCYGNNNNNIAATH